MPDKPIALEDRDSEGDKLYSPSAGRNKDVISQWLGRLLPQNASILELGSGTGEHGATLGDVRPDILWQYSDPDLSSRKSQLAWAKPDWPDPLNIDLLKIDWAESLKPYDVIFSANMIHIAPIEVCQNFAIGASNLTDTVILYGPFLFGAESVPSNLDFDASLKRRDSRWGVREIDFVKHIFENAGFKRSECFEMPRNNHIVRFSKP